MEENVNTVESNPPCDECGGKTHKQSGRMTRTRGYVHRWQCTECGHFMTEGAQKRKPYVYKERNYTVVEL